ncbi:hypothetical protein ASPBRDRAFT_266108 [Aspergillus brasiliensis CBS 101740]|uniref:Uncharacterized protein n=1 Tax=Aspergillus brasiliensis (strain CBS 101740 / IMI 381727 / IBT 21946) TaxID=767769 RepID=A0A1L9V305_ASPBC|nr:hypothetical protein ASPBRDRAFT_266108 [Aspergillus brasiliensis CBS 101740]
MNLDSSPLTEREHHRDGRTRMRLLTYLPPQLQNSQVQNQKKQKVSLAATTRCDLITGPRWRSREASGGSLHLLSISLLLTSSTSPFTVLVLVGGSGRNFFHAFCNGVIRVFTRRFIPSSPFTIHFLKLSQGCSFYGVPFCFFNDSSSSFYFFISFPTFDESLSIIILFFPIRAS